MSDHGGVVAMGLLDPPASILQTMPLCEIESFQTIEGETGFGTSYSILATIRVVGRCSLVGLDENGEHGFLKGWCIEVVDDAMSVDGRTSGGRDIIQLGNDLADRLDSVFESILRLENELMLMDDEDDSLEPIKIKIVDKINIEDPDSDDEYDQEDEHDDEDDDSLRLRFKEALHSAKVSDTQGYKISSSSTFRNSDNIIRPIQDLAALSWAYFSKELWTTEILHFRLKALEVDELCERMKVALIMMMEYRSKLKETLKKSKGSGSDDNF